MSTSRERPPFDIKIARTPDEVEACYDIRVEVFSVEQGFPLDTEIDEYDPMSLHFLLTTPVSSPPESSLQSLLPGQSDEARSRTSTPKPIGTIRLTPSVGKVSRLAVDKAYRSYGFGRVLVEALDEHVKKLKGDELAEWGTVREEAGKQVVRLRLHSQMQVVPFYKKLGYTPEGDEFDEEGAPHLKMVRDVVLA